MKRKLTTLVLAFAVMASMSVPAFAASCQTPARSTCPANALLWQMLCRYGGNCGSGSDCSDGSCAGQALDANALLGQLLSQYGGKAATPAQQTPTAPAEQETPAAQEPQTPAQQTQTATTTASAYEREVIRLVNAERAKAGLAALSVDAALTRTARMKSQDMRDNRYFDHNSPTYGTPFQLMKSQGIAYRTAGENIAMGYATPQAVVTAWMNSAGHRANILNASYTRIGVGYVASGNYWTQHFAG